eukprot:CAMPEP_0172195860 /NCGR_PEP_ID=MMETSP1050-20130122/26464_1 /TAXON_ID=233186 /ORGANISM="Cryptomonas curvata, Strain CCAP979/52" /LENGTH=547 /DNA_ID=CAMNT_0012872013 /DNA_START=418 /DNA_END=2058 /DNA_ORIENTATION=+
MSFDPAVSELHVSTTGEMSYLLGPCSVRCVPMRSETFKDSEALNYDFKSETLHYDFITLDAKNLNIFSRLAQLKRITFSFLMVESDPSPVWNYQLGLVLNNTSLLLEGKDNFQNSWFYNPLSLPDRFNLSFRGHFVDSHLNCSKYFDLSKLYSLTPGWVIFENFHIVGSDIIFIQDQSQPMRFDLAQWTLNEDEILKKFHHRALGNARPFQARVIDIRDISCSLFGSRGRRYTVDGAIILTDFLPRMIPHYYHMLEHLLGIWTTMESFLPNASNPEWILLPQTEAVELSAVVRDLLTALFPSARIVDSSTLKLISQKLVLHFLWSAASDRSATDHGQVNQMLTGMLQHLKRHSHSFVSRIATSMQQFETPQLSLPLVLLFVSREGSRNRNLSPGAQRNMLDALKRNCKHMVLVSEKNFADEQFAQQFASIRAARMLLGVHGNGLSNLLWLPMPGGVIELFPSDARILAYQQFAEARHLFYLGLVGPHGAEYMNGSCGDTALDYERQCSWVMTQRGEINSIFDGVHPSLLTKQVHAMACSIAHVSGLY